MAVLLARAGRDVQLLERDPAPTDKVCGDFLSVEAQRSLDGLGLSPFALGASPISSVRLFHREDAAAAALPFPAFGLSRRTLDAALLDLAAGCGAVVRRGAKVHGITSEDSALTLGTGETLHPDTLFLATGKHELRGAPRPVGAPRSVGFKTYLSLAPAQTEALRGAVELVLFDGGYAGLLLVEANAANLSLVVSGDRLARAGGTWESLLASLQTECSALARRLAGATSLRARPLAISRLPYGFIHAPRDTDPLALYRLGDQAAVIPSLTGDGVALALHTARRGAEAFLAGRSSREYHASLRSELRGQMARASLLQNLCLSGTLQPTVLRACRMAPALLRVAASWTRIAGEAAISATSAWPNWDRGAPSSFVGKLG